MKENGAVILAAVVLVVAGLFWAGKAKAGCCGGNKQHMCAMQHGIMDEHAAHHSVK